MEMMMTKVTKIDWTVETGDTWWSGTDTTVELEILRDGALLQRALLEPGHTPRLNRGERTTYFWEFVNPSNLGVSVSGVTVPYSVEFGNGVRNHLKVRLVAKGDDAWEKVWIESTVYSGQLRSVPGTLDGVRWQQNEETFSFGADVVLSTDATEGYASWTLNY
jgi:hypothetical protein